MKQNISNCSSVLCHLSVLHFFNRGLKIRNTLNSQILKQANTERSTPVPIQPHPPPQVQQPTLRSEPIETSVVPMSSTMVFDAQDSKTIPINLSHLVTDMEVVDRKRMRMACRCPNCMKPKE